MYHYSSLTLIWRFSPFSVHGLPDLLYPTFFVSYRRLPVLYLEQIYLFLPNKINLPLGFPTGLSTLKHPLVLFGGYENDPSLLHGQASVACSGVEMLKTPHRRYNL